MFIDVLLDEKINDFISINDLDDFESDGPSNNFIEGIFKEIYHSQGFTLIGLNEISNEDRSNLEKVTFLFLCQYYGKELSYFFDNKGEPLKNIEIKVPNKKKDKSILNDMSI